MSSTKSANDGNYLSVLSNYSIGGIDFSLPGNGGEECRLFISPERRLVEDLVAIAISLAALVIGWRRHRRPPSPRVLGLTTPSTYTPFRVLLLVLMTFAYALEVCYKLASRQFVFVVNPCHMLCVVQIVLLAWPANRRWITYLYRFHLFYLHGPLNASVFPVTNTLFLPGEVFTYWFEHAMILIIPFYLLRRGGKLYTVSEPFELSWSLLSYGVWGLFHFAFLEPLAYITEANLNSMLCPAIVDPFFGPNWRLWALGHQFLLNLVAGKLFGLLGIREEEAVKTNGFIKTE